MFVAILSTIKKVSATSTEKMVWKKNMTLVYSMYPYELKASSFGKKIKGAKKITIKSSNKKVVNVDYYPGNGDYVYPKRAYYKGWFYISPLKKGTARITITIKKKNKKYKIRSVVHSAKYKNPIKKFKIRKKNLSKKYKKMTFYQSKFKFKKKDRVDIKARKGWKIKKLYLWYMNTKTGKYKKMKIKNHKKFKAKKDADIVAELYNKKKHQYVTITMRYKSKNRY